MSDRLARQFAFLNEADRLKSVSRANVLSDLSRAENSAEHSWHGALYGMVFGASDRALAMLVLHDLVEIDCGDHPIHLPHDADAVALAEARAARRLFGILPEPAPLAGLWDEFASGRTAAARQALRMDHVQPLFQVLGAPAPLPAHLQIVRDNLDRGRAARLDREWPAVMQAARCLLAGQCLPEHDSASRDLAARLRFLIEADRLKSVLRANTLIDRSRRENTAEHSWHLALYALVLADQAGPGVNVGRAIRMLLLHDLVEIDVGDVPIHSANGQAHGSDQRRQAELAAAQRLFGLLPAATGAGFLALWREFEEARSADAIFAKALDRCQPLMQNLASGGAGWVEYDVGYAQVESRVGVWIDRGAPDIWRYLDLRLKAHFAA
ncbi:MULTISPECIES: HD domain-containing protein [unclassified Paracoccus (in: a-proteobacteria)]|uniref:HD domain-containing protein n=1 Tax=unclassified Paracoccus (in: a-proteobacteria) TaxID=2688777 RepID=UPI0012B27C96|nr:MULTISPECIES: HD domain-containing protein [unclassified Paracoccus (in: a-proteobacteria)]UXU73859.1 HD domain-containing protein [Paracoccus sp. SMMA_5]UXU79747.1 HD domain-containing protein [Paracoccus sp. SMMA_5_TC]